MKPETREGREARKLVMEGIDVIAKGLQTRAAAANDSRLAPLIDKIYAKLREKPDEYFLTRLYPTNSTMDPGAFQKIWKEVAATLK